MYLLWFVTFFVNCGASVVINVKIDVPGDSPLLVAEHPFVLAHSSGFEILSSTIEIVFVTVANNDQGVDNATSSQMTSTPTLNPLSNFSHGAAETFFKTELIYSSIGLGILFFFVIAIYHWYRVNDRAIRTEPPKIAVRITPPSNHQGFIRTSNKGFRVNSRKY